MELKDVFDSLPEGVLSALLAEVSAAKLGTPPVETLETGEVVEVGMVISEVLMGLPKDRLDNFERDLRESLARKLAGGF